MYNRWVSQGELYHYGVLGMKWGVHKARKYRSEGQVAAEVARQKMRAANAWDSNRLSLISDKPITKVSEDTVKNNKMSVPDLLSARDRAYNQASRERNAVISKSSKKLEKLNAKYEKRQAKADRLYDKAERKSASLLASKRSTDKAFRKASKWQYKANRVALRGKRWYEEMEKAYSSADIKMSKRNQEIGKELVRQVRANSRAMYAASYAGGR